MWQAGFRSPVGRMGTHLSAAQAQSLRRLFKHLVIVPDGDEAGRKSADQIYMQLSPFMPVTIAEMPDGADADSVSSSELIELLNAATPIDYRLAI